MEERKREPRPSGEPMLFKTSRAEFDWLSLDPRAYSATSIASLLTRRTPTTPPLYVTPGIWRVGIEKRESERGVLV